MHKTILNSNATACPVCGDIALQAQHGLKEVEHKGFRSSIFEESHHCTSCGSIIFSAEDVRENRRAWIRFRKQIENVPLGCEIYAMRHLAGITQQEAAKLFGGGPVSFSKYENDDLIPDGAMVNLLRLAISFPETIQRLKNIENSPIRINFYEYRESNDWGAFDTDSKENSEPLLIMAMHSSSQITESREESWTIQ
ncbi:MAG: type II TA system antitoxin MqsA family protein [Burkholderiaceae bacterium]